MSKKPLRFVSISSEELYTRDNLVENEQVVNELHNLLINSSEAEEALRYLLDLRGLTRECIAQFKLGYLPRRLKIDGLAAVFNGRIVIPIFNAHGEVVGLSSRALDGCFPKYCHTQFKRNTVLYGLNLAKEFVIRKNLCYLVEGFFDVMSLWNLGVRNVVATMGAGIDRLRACLVYRYTSNVALIPDHDEAGNIGMMSIKKVLSSEPFNMKVFKVVYPDSYKDIDEYLRSSRTNQNNDFIKGLREAEGFKKHFIKDNLSELLKDKMSKVLGV